MFTRHSGAGRIPGRFPGRKCYYTALPLLCQWGCGKKFGGPWDDGKKDGGKMQKALAFQGTACYNNARGSWAAPYESVIAGQKR